TAKSQVVMVDSKRDLDRKTELLQRQLVAQADKDTSQATHDSAIAQLEASRATEQSLAAAIQSAQAQLAVMQAALDSARAQVMQIRKAAQNVQNVITYTVVVAVPNPEGKLLPGMTANVKLVTAEKPSVLKVPNAALRFRPPGAEGAPPAGRGSAPPPAPPAGGGGSSGRESLETLR